MRTKKANKSGKWWAGTKTTWAIKSGSDWWLVPGSEFPEKKLNDNAPKIKKPVREKSLLLDKNYLFLIVICSLLGLSLALNVIHYMLK